MGSYKKISVIVVNWNGKKWLNRCLSSLTSQTYPNLEIILVDNGSSDGSPKYIEENFPTVHIVRSSNNHGFAGGNNLGISEATGDLIMMLNNDAWIKPDAVAKLVSFYESNSFDVIAPYEVRYGADADLREYNIKIDITGHPKYVFNLEKSKPAKDFYLSGVCVLFGRELYRGTGGLDNDFFMYFEEIDWFWRLHLLGKKISHVPGVAVHHAGAGSSGSGIKPNSFLWRNENVLQMLVKNYSGLMLILIIPLYLAINLVELVVFLVVFRWDVAVTYPKGWLFNLRHLRRTWRKHQAIQKKRLVGDREILHIMHRGLAKLTHLTGRIRKYITHMSGAKV